MTKSTEDIIFRGLKILEVGDDYLIGARGYRIFRFNRKENRWHFFGKIKDRKFSCLSRFRLLSRLFRAEVYFLKTMKNGQQVCIAKKGVFIRNRNTGVFEKSFDILRGTRPFNICEDDKGNIFFGEYFHNPGRESVHIYMSRDYGLNWEIAYTFPAKSIRHIHVMQFDEFTGSVWVTTGDLDGECMIGNTKDTFRTFDIVFQGGQEYRACKLLFFKDKILYGTDSETAVNQFKQFDRKTLRLAVIAEVQGSVINSVKIGEKCFVNTTVEPSEVNKDIHSWLWMYDDITGECFTFAKFEKDAWDHRYFQFGQCLFPEYVNGDDPYVYFYGCALKKIDGNSLGLDISKIRKNSN